MIFKTVSSKRRWDEEAKVAEYRQRLQAVFVRLSNEGHIEGADVMAHTKSNKIQSYAFQYVILLKNIDHDVTFIFHVKFKNDIKKVEINSNSRRCIFTMPPTFNEHVLYRLIYETIVGWEKGEESEKLFLNCFFLSLKKTFPDRILSAYKTPDRQDKIQGIDFVVRFLELPYYEPREVAFNLKSSRFFLREHKNHHPTVSTFIFTPFDLENQDQLQERFFRFIGAARERVVHF